MGCYLMTLKQLQIQAHHPFVQMLAFTCFAILVAVTGVIVANAWHGVEFATAAASLGANTSAATKPSKRAT
jgi:hypothetical protein